MGASCLIVLCMKHITTCDAVALNPPPAGPLTGIWALLGSFFSGSTPIWARAQPVLLHLLWQPTTPAGRWDKEPPHTADEWSIAWGGGKGRLGSCPDRRATKEEGPQCCAEPGKQPGQPKGCRMGHHTTPLVVPHTVRQTKHDKAQRAHLYCLAIIPKLVFIFNKITYILPFHYKMSVQGD